MGAQVPDGAVPSDGTPPPGLGAGPARTVVAVRGSRGLPIVAAQMLEQGDKDGDKALSKEEFALLADTWFDKLDPDKTGQASQEQFTSRLRNLFPASASASRAPTDSSAGPGRGPDATSPGISFDVLGPIFFNAADADKDGSLSRAEFKQAFTRWFDSWDVSKTGKLTEESLRKGLEAALPRSGAGARNTRTVTTRTRSSGEDNAPSARAQEPPPAAPSRTPGKTASETRDSQERSLKPAGSDFAAFKLIADRNIFNTTRRGGRREAGEEAPAKRVDSFTLVGTLLHEKGAYAFFDGSSSEYRQVLSPGKSIASYTVTDVSKDGVKLESGTNTVQMRVGMQMRREEDGPWAIVAGSGPPPSVSSTSSASSSDSSSDDDSDIVKRLMKQREQELK